MHKVGDYRLLVVEGTRNLSYHKHQELKNCLGILLDNLGNP
ncbi:hypothetical protein PL9214640332 [Planktothrix tepida PCC 9214]|uniref:Uncharacterized protein n=1 Tax=Planktothrix tepida PCC 9214 TaxID=671072 RepID=A0A1J1LP35_9CYAN|nr:hypothetical protein PL9214640332 [Planktothrix tepida PCC 9214]